MYIIFTTDTELLELAKSRNNKVLPLENFDWNSLCISDKYPQSSKFILDNDDNILDFISSLLLTLGFSASQDGFDYLKHAIKYTLNAPQKQKNCLNIVYLDIAKSFNTTVQNVNNCIRISIETAFKNGYLSDFDKIFKIKLRFEKNKTTNKRFIIAIKNFMQERCLIP